MTTLIVFDSSISSREKNVTLYLDAVGEVLLFSLTSDEAVSKSLFEVLTTASRAPRMLDTARLVNFSAERLRDKYLKFIAELPFNILSGGRNIKEAFALDSNTSLWWLSLVAEKSNFKSDAFNRISQLDAVIEVIDSSCADSVLCASVDNVLNRSILSYCKKKGIRANRMNAPGFMDILQMTLQCKLAIYVGHIYLLFRAAAGSFIRMLKVKSMALKKGGASRMEKYVNRPMLITYYPVMDMALAKQGIFKNLHYDSMQDAMTSEDLKPVWVALYLKRPSISHQEAVRYAEKFIDNGYFFCLLDEFASVMSHLCAFLRTIFSGVIFLFHEKAIADMHDFGKYNIYSFLRNDWYSSFCGSACYNGVLYYEMFKALFMNARSRKCFYPSEMQPWEKALMSARDILKKDIKLIAYQPGAPSRMLLGCFNYPTEFKRDCAYPMPIPDKFMCNGNVTYRNMIECGWPKERLGIVEAIRYGYLKGHMVSMHEKRKKIVLLLFSISVHESSAILKMAYHALSSIVGVEIWMRPHPFLRIEDVLKRAGLNMKEISFKIKAGSIADSLAEARIVIGGESGTCLEALAFGCNVVIVNNPEWINMSSLISEKSEVVKTASSAEELRMIIEGIFAAEYDPGVFKKESTRIVNNFFYIDPVSDKPLRILELLKEDR